MTEYITKEQAEKIAKESGLLECRPSWMTVPEFMEVVGQLINLAFEQRLEVAGYVRKDYANILSAYGNTLLDEECDGLRKTPLYALKGDIK
jgi:hypothetical protein